MSDRIGSTTIVAVFGGLASDATGGDFYEGAMRAAFVHLYNDLSAKQLSEVEDLRSKNSAMADAKLKMYQQRDERHMKAKALYINDVQEFTKILGQQVAYRRQISSLKQWGPHELTLFDLYGDALGLGLSIGATYYSGGLSLFLGSSALLVDIAQPDYPGAVIGGSSMIYKNPYTIGADLLYGTYQVIK